MRAFLPLTVVLLVAACSSPSTGGPTPPALSALAGETADLSSLAALAAALELDLDAATAQGGVTVFAPSNALLDAYAQRFEFDDAADLLDWLEGATDAQRAALTNFVAAHLVVYAPGLMTETFLTADLGEDVWEVVNDRVSGDGIAYARVWRGYLDIMFGDLATSLAPPTPELRLALRGAASGSTFGATVEQVDFVLADVAFAGGLVHVIDGTIPPLLK